MHSSKNNTPVGPSAERQATVFVLEGLFWTSFWAIPFLTRIAMDANTTNEEIRVGLFISFVLACGGALWPRWRTLYLIGCFIVLSIGSFVATGIALAGMGIATPGTMTALLDTDPEDSASFLTTVYGARDYGIASLCFLLPLIPLTIIIRRRLAWAIAPITCLVGVLGLLFAQIVYKYVCLPLDSWARTVEVASADFPHRSYAFSVYTPVKPYIQIVQAMRLRKRINDLLLAPKRLSGLRRVEPDGDTEVFVVVIGESLAKRHMSLYGYSRETTPALDALARADELIVFDDAVTTHAQTGAALFDALTWSSSDNSQRPSLLDIFRGLNFKSYWLSNQPDDFLPLITHSADVHKWNSIAAAQGEVLEWNEEWKLPERERKRSNFDEELLPEITAALSDKAQRKIIFVHLMGSHAVYRARFPSSAEHFQTIPSDRCRTETQLQTINDYDNSVRYNDSVVARIIEEVRKSRARSFVLYFSDHGEEVYDFRNFATHSDEIISPYMAEIPLVIWFSPEYKSAHKEIVARASQFRGRPYIHTNLPFSLSFLAGIVFDDLDPRKNIFSDEFAATARVVANRDYDRLKQEWQPTEAYANGISLLQCRP